MANGAVDELSSGSICSWAFCLSLSSPCVKRFKDLLRVIAFRTSHAASCRILGKRLAVHVGVDESWACRNRYRQSWKSRLNTYPEHMLEFIDRVCRTSALAAECRVALGFHSNCPGDGIVIFEAAC